MGTQLTATRNVYSPCAVQQGGQLVLYVGGWGPDQAGAPVPQDEVYRCVVGSPPDGGLSVLQPVLRPQDYGMGLFNDPAIVLMPGGYYVMYLTVVADPTPGAGNTITNNAVYYSTSWADDGVNWSRPAPLVEGAWCPSATVGPDGSVRLWASSTANGALLCYDLGASGVAVGEPATCSAPGAYCNVDVAYRPSIGLYQMLGQLVARDAGGDPTASTVDLLHSADGVTWTLDQANLLPSVQFANTPASYPTTDGWMYVAEEPDASWADWNVYFEPWL